MERWLENVAKLEYPTDLLLVDNSPTSSYIEIVKGYCKKYGITNYKLVHIDVTPDMEIDERLARSRELIRREVLGKGYDAWYSLECDVIVPPDALTKLVDLIKDYWMASHAYPSRSNPDDFNIEFGTTLIKHQTLERYGFLDGYGYCDPLRPDSKFEGDVWFIRRINRDKEAKNINLFGIIKPIYHLAQ
jgi:hypothetical protein